MEKSEILIKLVHRLSLLFGSKGLTVKDMLKLFQLYHGLSGHDKIGVLARLICLQPIAEMMKKYIARLSVIVDLGCGYGLLSNFAALNFAATVYGVDNSYPRIQIARKSAAENIDVHFYHDNILKTKLPKCNAILLIDVCLMLNDLEYQRLLAKCRQALKPDGVLIIKDTTKEPFWKSFYTYLEDKAKFALSVYGYKFHGTPKHRSPSETKTILERSKFKIVEKRIVRTILPYPGIIYVCKSLTTRRKPQRHQDTK